VCTVVEEVGDMVYSYVDFLPGDTMEVRVCDSTDLAKLPAIGMIVEKPTSVLCVVQRIGVVSGVYTGLTRGKPYYVDENGELARWDDLVRPGWAQLVARAVSSEELWLDPQLSMTGLVP
jgi:hypothetical protein